MSDMLGLVKEKIDLGRPYLLYHQAIIEGPLLSELLPSRQLMGNGLGCNFVFGLLGLGLVI